MTIICCGKSLPLCKHDKKEIENLIFFKKRLKKTIDKAEKACYNKDTKEERSWQLQWFILQTANITLIY